MGIFEVFYQPGKLFESLKDRKFAWVLPLIVNIILLTGVTVVTLHFVGMETIIRQRLEGTRLSPEQMDLAMSRAQSPAQTYITYAGAAVGAPLTLLALAGLLSIFAMLSNRQPKFGAMFSMVTLAYLPYALVSGLMTTLVLLASPDRTSLDITNLLATNPAAFMDKATTGRGRLQFDDFPRRPHLRRNRHAVLWILQSNQNRLFLGPRRRRSPLDSLCICQSRLQPVVLRICPEHLTTITSPP